MSKAIGIWMKNGSWGNPAHFDSSILHYEWEVAGIIFKLKDLAYAQWDCHLKQKNPMSRIKVIFKKGEHIISFKSDHTLYPRTDFRDMSQTLEDTFRMMDNPTIRMVQYRVRERLSDDTKKDLYAVYGAPAATTMIREIEHGELALGDIDLIPKPTTERTIQRVIPPKILGAPVDIAWMMGSTNRSLSKREVDAVIERWGYIEGNERIARYLKGTSDRSILTESKNGRFTTVEGAMEHGGKRQEADEFLKDMRAIHGDEQVDKWQAEYRESNKRGFHFSDMSDLSPKEVAKSLNNCQLVRSIDSNTFEPGITVKNVNDLAQHFGGSDVMKSTKELLEEISTIELLEEIKSRHVKPKRRRKSEPMTPDNVVQFASFIERMELREEEKATVQL